MDLGDKQTHYCVIDDQCQIVAQGALATTETGFSGLFQALAKTTVALEAGTHSPWASRHLASLGHEVIVANPRQLPLISETSPDRRQPTASLTGLPTRLNISTRVSMVNFAVFLLTTSDTRGRETIRISAASACFR